MKSSHRFPLRRQIVWGMRFFTILTSLAVGAALFTLSNQYVRANALQAAEFNLRLVATSIETSLDSADALLNWASIDSTVRRYISQENINGTQTIAAYEAVQEKYYSSTLYSHILRFFITNENDRHLQFGALNASAALNRRHRQRRQLSPAPAPSMRGRRRGWGPPPPAGGSSCAA